jgi:hypothetical protein
MRRLFFTGLLTACAPGDLNAWGENTTLQSAWVHSVGQDLNGLLLSTIRLPCLLGENTDPSEALLESQSLEHVYTQEGSQLIWVPLEGSLQELEKDPSVQALYFEVIESETLWTDQLLAAYRATESRSEQLSGELLLSKENETWSGSLSLNQNALHADFRAETCESPELFQILGLLELN